MAEGHRPRESGDLDQHAPRITRRYAALHPGVAPGAYVQIEIADTGMGMPPDVVEHIFEPFFTTKPVGEGTGLGLDLAWNIVVKKHRGDLRVESVPGNTRFIVLLPLEKPRVEDLADPDLDAELTE